MSDLFENINFQEKGCFWTNLTSFGKIGGVNFDVKHCKILV